MPVPLSDRLDRQVARLALERSLVSPRQFEEAGGLTKGLLASGALSPAQVQDLCSRLSESRLGAVIAIPPFGAIAVRRGFVTAETVEEIIRNQTRLFGSGIRFALGELLVRKGFLTLDQALEILSEQGIAILECANCSSHYNVFGGRSGKFSCPACDKPLAPPKRVRSLEVRGTLNKPLGGSQP